MFNNYQQESCGTFKPPVELTPEQIHLLDWSLGLGGEAGEVFDLLKHSIFHKEDTLDKMELAKELGDVLWYVSAIATTCNIDLADIASLNRAKLLSRYGNGYSDEASAQRHSKEEELKQSVIYKCLAARILNTGNAPVNVFVFGPDGSGKTTFTKLLEEYTDLTRVKCDYRQENKPQAAKHMLSRNIDMIYDRFYYPDDYIYSVVKQLPLTNEYVNELFSVLPMMLLVNPIFIYIDADMDVLKERSAAWADDYVSVDDLLKIKEEYQKWLSKMQEMNIPIIHIDTSHVKVGTHAYEELLHDVIHQVQDYRKYYGTPRIMKEEES